MLTKQQKEEIIKSATSEILGGIQEISADLVIKNAPAAVQAASKNLEQVYEQFLKATADLVRDPDGPRAIIMILEELGKLREELGHFVYLLEQNPGVDRTKINAFVLKLLGGDSIINTLIDAIDLDMGLISWAMRAARTIGLGGEIDAFLAPAGLQSLNERDDFKRLFRVMLNRILPKAQQIKLEEKDISTQQQTEMALAVGAKKEKVAVADVQLITQARTDLVTGFHNVIEEIKKDIPTNSRLLVVGQKLEDHLGKFLTVVNARIGAPKSYKALADLLLGLEDLRIVMGEFLFVLQNDNIPPAARTKIDNFIKPLFNSGSILDQLIEATPIRMLLLGSFLQLLQLTSFKDKVLNFLKGSGMQSLGSQWNSYYSNNDLKALFSVMLTQLLSNKVEAKTLSKVEETEPRYAQMQLVASEPKVTENDNASATVSSTSLPGAPEYEPPPPPALYSARTTPATSINTNGFLTLDLYGYMIPVIIFVNYVTGGALGYIDQTVRDFTSSSNNEQASQQQNEKAEREKEQQQQQEQQRQQKLDALSLLVNAPTFEQLLANITFAKSNPIFANEIDYLNGLEIKMKEMKVFHTSKDIDKNSATAIENKTTDYIKNCIDPNQNKKDIETLTKEYKADVLTILKTQKPEIYLFYAGLIGGIIGFVIGFVLTWGLDLGATAAVGAKLGSAAGVALASMCVEHYRKDNSKNLNSLNNNFKGAADTIAASAAAIRPSA